MEKKRFVLVDPDPVYLERFLEYVHRKPNFLFAAVGLTGVEQLSEEAEQGDIDVALVDENCWQSIGKGTKKELLRKIPCLILLSDRIRSAEDHLCVCRYQSMEKLLPEILSYYEETRPPAEEPEERTQVDIFYAPAGRCGKTTCALLLGHRLAEQCGRTVLYMNLEALDGSVQREDGHSLSDLLYYRQTTGGLKLQSLAGTEGSLSLLDPVVNPQDLWQLESGELGQLLREIKEAGIYDTVIVDLGPGRDPLPILMLGRRVFLVDDRDAVDHRMDAFLAHVRQTYGEIPGNWHRVQPPKQEALAGQPAGSRCEPLESWLEKEWMTWNQRGKKT